jgi:hypothetical protein
MFQFILHSDWPCNTFITRICLIQGKYCSKLYYMGHMYQQASILQILSRAGAWAARGRPVKFPNTSHMQLIYGHYVRKLLKSNPNRFKKIAVLCNKEPVMDVIGSLCVSLGSSTIHLHDSLGIRCACECTEAGFSSQNGDYVWRVYYWRAVFCFAIFL